jgi:phosphonate transport system permease protein
VLKWASRAVLQLTRVMPELTLALVFVVWVGGGPLAGMLAIAVHNMGVMGRLYSDVLEEVEPGPPGALQAQGAGTLATFLFGVLPQVKARLAALTLYRFEVNVRATAMVGFVGAGGIGDALNTAISLFHLRDLTLLLLTMLLLISVVDAIGDRVRSRILGATPQLIPRL